MATLTNAFEINGVIDTGKNVLDNLNALCTSAGCWLSYDVTTGLWSVIINRSGSSIKSFGDSNIIGSINVSGTGITELYNKVSVEFPHKDLRDQTDYVDLSIPTANRFPNEQDNTLTIRLDTVNDPVQAQYLGTVELKQSRVDRIIEFRTDYTALTLRAGDLIDVTNSAYGFSSKVFRIITITEDDTDDGRIEMSITALEYDADVYDTAGLVREERIKKTGIIPKSQNSAITSSDNASNTKSLTDALLDPANAALVALLMAALTRQGSGPGLVPVCDVFQVNALSITADNFNRVASLGRTVTLPYTGRYKINYNINWGSNIDPSPPLGMIKTSEIKLTLNGSNVSLGEFANTGDDYVQVYEDHNLTGLFSATQGQSLSYSFEYRSNLSSGSYSVPSGYPSFTVPGGTQVLVWIISELVYLGT